MFLPVAVEVDRAPLQGVAALEFAPVRGVEVDSRVRPGNGQVSRLPEVQPGVYDLSGPGFGRPGSRFARRWAPPCLRRNIRPHLARLQQLRRR